MFPRNLMVYRFGTLNCDDVEVALTQHPIRDPGPQDLSTSGFTSPYGRTDDRLTVRCGEAIGFTYQVRYRDLRPRSVNDEVAKRAQKIADDEGRKVGNRERKRIRDDVWNELLPRALVASSNVRGWVDVAGGRVVIDTRSRRTSETVLSKLREAFGSLPAVPPSPAESPRILMTEWLASGDLPGQITLGKECDLRDPGTAHGSAVHCRRQDLAADEVREHLRSGKQCFASGLVFDDRLSLTLTDDLTVRALRQTDIVANQSSDHYESQDEETEGTFALAVLEVTRLLVFLEQTFKIPHPKEGMAHVAP